MIKGRSPFPFETIALAVTFTPRLPYMVSEMKRLCDLHNATAVFIHIGKKTGDKQRELSVILSLNGFHDGNSRVHWEMGEVVNSILRICKNEVVDLIVVGDTEIDDLKLPTGRTTTSLATKAKCSVLIYTRLPSGGFNKIVLNRADHEKTELTILTSIYFAEKEKLKNLIVAEENNSSAFPESSSEFKRNDIFEGSMVFKNTMEKTAVGINTISLVNEDCSTVTEYASKINADLLITHSSDHLLLIFDRISSSDGIENLLKNLPCNLLIVHSRLPD